MTYTDKEFSRFISANFNIVYSILNEYIPEEWHDDVQQIMIFETWKAFKIFKGKCLPTTYMYKVCLNVATTWLRSHAVKQQNRRMFEAIGYYPNCEDPYALSNERFYEVIEAWVKSLTGEDKHLITERYYNGRSCMDIGKEIGITRNLVAVKIHRLLQKLKPLCYQKLTN